MLLVLVLILQAWVSSAAAQSTAKATLSEIDASDFPVLHAYLDVHTQDGGFVYGLKADQVTILENDQRLPVDEFQQIFTDVQFITAITLGPSFGVRDGLGNSRYDYILNGMKNWQRDLEAADDLSLLISGGPELVHSTSFIEWQRTLASFQPDPRNTTPNLQLLSRALEIAADPLPRPGMERMVLFITPPLGIEATIGLQSLAGRAQQDHVRIFVWLVAAPEYDQTPEAAMLRELTEQTGGQYFFFSGSEPVPDLENYLKPLRTIYTLTFSSAVRSSGAFPVRAEINTNNLNLSTPDLMVQYQVLAPNLIFLNTPVEIERSLLGNNQTNRSIQATPPPLEKRLTPAEQTVNILVEFPDGDLRSLQHSALYANGELVAENIQPPFEQFTWDLRAITQTQSYLLRAEVTDSLGLTGSTIDLPVQVTIKLPEQGFKLAFSNQGLLLAGLIVLLAGAVLVLVLLIGGRIRPRVFGRPPARSRQNQAATRPLRSRNDPVTQPVPIQQAASKATRRWGLPVQLRMPNIPSLPRLPGRETGKRAGIYLDPLLVGEEAAPLAPLLMTADEIVLGRSPTQATWAINDPSLEAVHAFFRREENTYRLVDAGSIAGCWVNYLLVPREGILLQHGDLVHLGGVGFRFSQRVPGRTRKPAIIVYNSE